jgi:hypothetical protein
MAQGAVFHSPLVYAASTLALPVDPETVPAGPSCLAIIARAGGQARVTAGATEELAAIAESSSSPAAAEAAAALQADFLPTETPWPRQAAPRQVHQRGVGADTLSQIDIPCRGLGKTAKLRKAVDWALAGRRSGPPGV